MATLQEVSYAAQKSNEENHSNNNTIENVFSEAHTRMRLTAVSDYRKTRSFFFFLLFYNLVFFK